MPQHVTGRGNGATTGSAGDRTDATRPVRTAAEGEALLLDLVRENADALLRVARRHSRCDDDAHDAYQRALEIAVRHARRLDAETARAWLFTVTRNESLALAHEQERRGVELDADADAVGIGDSSPEDWTLDREHLSRSAEALRHLKPHELRALWMSAAGGTYADIARATGWSDRKVTRCVTEGRRAFLRRYAEIEAGAECRRWAPVLAAMIDGAAPAQDVAAVRPHLRNCPGCRASVRALHRAEPGLRILLPPGVLLAAGVRSPGARVSGWLTRVAEAVVGPAHDRAAASALKLQVLGDAATSAKVVAVAASAAALAGGGAVAVRHDHRAAGSSSHPAATARRHAPARASSVPAASGPVRRSPRAAATPSSTSPRRAVHHASRRAAASASRPGDPDPTLPTDTGGPTVATGSGDPTAGLANAAVPTAPATTPRGFGP